MGDEVERETFAAAINHRTERAGQEDGPETAAGGMRGHSHDARSGDILAPVFEKFRHTRWSGSSELWIDPLGNDAAVSDATLSVEDDAIVYTWAYEGVTQTGRLTPGNSGVVWQDSWHQPEGVLCGSTGERRALFAVEYSYAAGPGPDWHWSIRLAERPDGSLVLQMTNITPWGEEGRAARMVFRQEP